MPIERANSRKKVTWISLFGLILIPALIAGGLIWANWNPQSRLTTVNAAIVNLDQAVTVDGSTVLLGRQLAAGLMDTTSSDTTNFSWHLETADGASSGLADGTYVAAITIPANFSAAATSFSGDAASATTATVQVTTSSTTAITDPTIAQAISQTAVSTLNKTLTTSYLSNIYVGFNTLATKMSDMSSGASQLASAGAQVDDGASSLASGLSSADSGASQLASGATSLTTGASAAASGASSLASGASSVASGATSLASGAAEVASGASTLAASGTTLASGASQLQAGVLAYTQAISGTPSSAGLTAAASGLKTAIDGAIAGISASASKCSTDIKNLGESTFSSQSGVVSILNSLTQDQRDTLLSAVSGTSCTVNSATLTGVATELSATDPSTGYSLSSLAATVADGLTQLSTEATKSGGLNDSTASLASGISAYTAGVSTLASGASSLSSGTSTLASGASTLASGASSLSSGTSTLASGVSTLSSGISTLSSGLSSASTGASQLASGTSQLSGGLDTFSAGVASGASSIPTYTSAEQSNLANVVAAPVQTSTVDASSLLNAYPGAALLIMLALWIGVIATFLVIRPVTRRAVDSSKSSLALMAQGLWPAAVVALFSTALVTAITASVLTLSFGTIAVLAVFTLAAALVFVIVNYALVAAFGGIGRFITVAMAVLGSATLLISGSPEFFTVAAALSPITPAIRGFIAIAAGSGGTGSNLVGLIAWAILGFGLSLIAVSRRRQAHPGQLEGI